MSALLLNADIVWQFWNACEGTKADIAITQFGLRYPPIFAFSMPANVLGVREYLPERTIYGTAGPFLS